MISPLKLYGCCKNEEIFIKVINQSWQLLTVVLQPLDAVVTAAESNGVLLIQTEARPEEILLQTAEVAIDRIPGAVAMKWICNSFKSECYLNRSAADSICCWFV